MATFIEGSDCMKIHAGGVTHELNGHSHLLSDANRFEVQITLKHCRPENTKVNVVNERELSVSASARSPNGDFELSFHRQIHLSHPFDKSTVSACFNDQGVLLIQGKRSAGTEISVQVVCSGQDRPSVTPLVIAPPQQAPTRPGGLFPPSPRAEQAPLLAPILASSPILQKDGRPSVSPNREVPLIAPIMKSPIEQEKIEIERNLSAPLMAALLPGTPVVQKGHRPSVSPARTPPLVAPVMHDQAVIDKQLEERMLSAPLVAPLVQGTTAAHQSRPPVSPGRDAPAVAPVMHDQSVIDKQLEERMLSAPLVAPIVQGTTAVHQSRPPVSPGRDAPAVAPVMHDQSVIDKQLEERMLSAPLVAPIVQGTTAVHQSRPPVSPGRDAPTVAPISPGPAPKSPGRAAKFPNPVEAAIKANPQKGSPIQAAIAAHSHQAVPQAPVQSKIKQPQGSPSQPQPQQLQAPPQASPQPMTSPKQGPTPPTAPSSPPKSPQPQQKQPQQSKLPGPEQQKKKKDDKKKKK